MKIQEALALFVKEECKHLSMQQRRNFTRSVMQAAIMSEIHRPASPSCIDIEAHRAEAKARLAKPKPEKSDYTPPHPDRMTVRLITPTLNTKGKEQDAGRAKRRNHVACQAKATHKSWGKGGVKLINLIARAKDNALKFEYAKQYAS
jgi:hypothetical protein